MRSTTLIAIVTLVAACRGREAGEHQAMPGVGNNPGMGGMTMRSDSLLPLMRAHLDSLAGVPPQFTAGMLAAHDAMASQMLDAMGGDMRMMDMPADSAWIVLADSIRRDLADLPALSGNALETRLRAHVERMRQLLAMHERMMRMHR